MEKKATHVQKLDSRLTCQRKCSRPARTELTSAAKFLFFFQAEDGIRDLYVTGVQTCAIPISRYLQQGLAGDTEPPACPLINQAKDLFSAQFDFVLVHLNHSSSGCNTTRRCDSCMS